MDLGLANKVALVTGGASGIGESMVCLLAEEGCAVAVVDRNADRGQRICEKLVASGHNAHFIRTDLGRFSDCQQAVLETLARLGRLDIVINNAGTNDSVGLDAGPAAFEQSLRRNLTHYYAIVHHAAPSLRAVQGAIVNVSSKVSVTGQGGTSGYAAAKGAVNALTREWAVDFAADEVRVNAVVPAEVWTPMYEQWLGQQEDGERERRRIAGRVPLGRRFTGADELARTAVFLASDAASHITGQIVFVDGGYTHLDRRI